MIQSIKRFFCKDERREDIQKIIEDVFEKMKPVEVLSMKPGDILILSHPRAISADALERLRQSLKKFIDGKIDGEISIVILEEGMKVNSVIKKNDQIRH